VGGKNVHVVITNDGTILVKTETFSGIKKGEAAEQTYEKALKQGKLKQQDVARAVATGSSGKLVTFVDGVIPDASAAVKGVMKLIPSARTIIDVGAEEGKVMKISPQGKVLDFAINERCAAGTGTFVETMARVLEIPVEDIGKLSLTSTRSIPMNAQCAVFAETEIVSLIHQKVPKHDIARAVHDAIASRIGSLIRTVGQEDDIVMIGGLARNIGFTESLKRDIGAEVKVPDDPDYVSAFGAAVAATAGVI